MKIPAAQELFKKHQEPGLELDPLQALKVRIATGRAQEDEVGDHCRLGSDAIGQALSLIEHGEARSLAEAYDGPISHSVLNRLVEASLNPAAETA